MLDINDASRKIGLNQAQTEDLQAYFQKLSETEKKSFGETDFIKLVEARGYKAQGSSDSEKPTLKESSAKTPATPQELKDLLRSFAGAASPAAMVMALLTEDASKQRMVNKELRAAQVEATAKEMEAQAKVMMEKAVTQLVLGVVSGAITIGSGVFGAAKSAKALGAGLSTGDATLTNTKISSQQQIASGVGSILGSVSDFMGTKYEAEIKEMDAKIERSRASAENFRDLNEALMELIRKCISTAEALSESANQARSKILA
ncbi:MAG: type III secretion system translocon subunit SctB [Deltaproteobacteria bacterium]|jgi:hypothetical protein|nr:type III secretion system translocon subunit SctB [Deltaproteobacteria bacterium]